MIKCKANNAAILWKRAACGFGLVILSMPVDADDIIKV